VIRLWLNVGTTKNVWAMFQAHLLLNTQRDTIILPVVFYGCETWSLTLRDELRSRTFEKRLLRIIFGLKMDKSQEVGENYVMSSFIIPFARYH
jgi:hypothetical protein